MYLRWPSSWRYLDLLHRAEEPQKGRNSCPRLQPCLIGSGGVGVWQSYFFNKYQLFYISASSDLRAKRSGGEESGAEAPSWLRRSRV